MKGTLWNGDNWIFSFDRNVENATISTMKGGA